MGTESMICSLRRLWKKYKSDFGPTSPTNWAELCFDVANRLEELNNENLKLKEQLQILTKTKYDICREFAEQLKSKPYFDEEHNMQSIPISFIDEVLAEMESDE